MDKVKPEDKELTESQNGRPALFSSPEAMEAMVIEYFKLFGKESTDEQREAKGIAIYEHRPTITGLCLFLGFESRQSFYAYEQKPGFSYTIKRARVKIENLYENMLLSKNTATGAIFALKNFEWNDNQKIELTDSRKATGDLFPLDDPNEISSEGA